MSTAIILAAGRSTRMESGNKLLLPLGDKTILEHVVERVCAAPVDEVVVVTGHEDRQIRDVLAGSRVRVAYNPEFASGMASSIRRGVLAAHADSEGYMICLGDMPMIAPDTYTRLCEAFEARDRPTILVAVVDGQRGHPVLFDATFRSSLLQLRHDIGAQTVIDENRGAVKEVEVQDPGILQDIDTQEAYAQLGPKEK